MANNLIVTNQMSDSDTNDDKDTGPLWAWGELGRPAGLSNGHVDPASGTSYKY